jgi:tetratricopeptide (TPR) repeat protein
LFFQLNRTEEAEKTLQRSLALDPKLTLSRVCLAQLRIRQNRLGEALDLLSAAVRTAPADRRALANYAYALSLKGELEPALQEYQKLLLLPPESGAYLAEMAGLQAELGLTRESEESLRQMEAHNPSDFSLFAARSHDYLRFGQGGLAAFSARNYLKHLFWNSEYSLNMAVVEHFGERMKGESSRSSAILEAALGSSTPEHWPYPILQFLSHQLGEKELLALAHDKDRQTEVHAYLALDLILQGNPTPALPHLIWVRDKGNRDFDEYFLAMALLDRLHPDAALPATLHKSPKGASASSNSRDR